MKSETFCARRTAPAPIRRRTIPTAVFGLVALAVVGCAPSAGPSSTAMSGAPAIDMSTTPPSPDPRVGLKPGRTDYGQAMWNMRLVSNTPTPPDFFGVTNSDLAFLGRYVIQGNYNGFMVWDVSNKSRPRLVKGYVCPASQSDVSVFENLLFVSSESTSGRLDCGTEPPEEAVSQERLRGLRIFDITDIENPVYLTNVQTCRGSHTHSVVRNLADPSKVYVYISGSSTVRPAEELAGCSELAPEEDPNSSLFRIEVIEVPLDAPETARIVSSPRIFSGLDAAPSRSAIEPRRRGNAPRGGPNQCHDITTYAEVGMAGGACQGYGILLNVTDPTAPRRITQVADTNFATWHSVTFNNEGTKVIFTDEWGGGSAPRCRATDSPVWGADAIFTIEDDELVFHSYYKLPAAQTETENCVAHNGSLVPIPDRDIKVQGWYQGGISIFEFTDPDNPREIAFFDRGPLIADTLRTAGSWSVYWYNGYMYNSEIARGLDVFELQPSGFITQNEIDAAKSVQFDYYNVQEQRKFVWPASFALARAYTDQLQRSSGLTAKRLSEVRTLLARAEAADATLQPTLLMDLAAELDADARASSDARKVRMLAQTARDLAGSGE